MTHFTAGALLLALSALGATASAQTPVLLRALSELPESITIDPSGDLYVSIGSTIQRLPPGGELEVYGTLPIAAFALGVKVGPDGCVYNASTSLDPAVIGAFVWRVCEQGVVEQFAALNPAGGPNDLAFDEQGNLYVTDPILGIIYKLDPDGTPTVWLDDPLLKGNAADPALFFSRQGVNGVAFDRSGKHLYVGNLDYGRILRIGIDHQGRPGTVEVFAESPELRGADGIAFDKKNNLYVAVGAQDQLVSVSRHGVVSVVAEGNLLNGPASLVFGNQCDDETTLYIADSDFLRAFGYITEPAEPNLLTLQTPNAGLPLSE
jgi:sugar lactone lactonase YvrE